MARGVKLELPRMCRCCRRMFASDDRQGPGRPGREEMCAGCFVGCADPCRPEPVRVAVDG